MEEIKGTYYLPTTSIDDLQERSNNIGYEKRECNLAAANTLLSASATCIYCYLYRAKRRLTTHSSAFEFWIVVTRRILLLQQQQVLLHYHHHYRGGRRRNVASRAAPVACLGEISAASPRFHLQSSGVGASR